MVLLLTVGTLAALAREKKPKPHPEPPVAPLQLAGGRSLTYEGSFSSEREVRTKQGFWGRVLDIVAGLPEFHELVRPYSIVTDSRGRIIITDPGVTGVHIFDFARQKYKFLSRDHGKDSLKSPQCVAVDASDNIYVADSEAGKIFVWDANGKFRRVIGSLKGGEGYFKRPTGIAVDSAANRIYVSDTYRHKVLLLDLQGSVLQEFGDRGSQNGQFNFPTELKIRGNQLFVVDAMNFRVQVLDRASGRFLFAIGNIGTTSGAMYRPKGVDVDSEGNIYVVDGIFETIQVFDSAGRLLYYFGHSGTGPEEFQLPAGLFIDRNDRIFVADSFNRRVQMFQYTAAKRQAPEETR